MNCIHGIPFSAMCRDCIEFRAVSDAIEEPTDTAELQIERRCDWLIRELDELCAMAANRETVDLIENEARSFGQMQTRVQLILSFLASRKPNKFRIIQNG